MFRAVIIGLLFFGVLIFLPSKVEAAAEVGIGTGKITLAEVLQENTTTELSPIAVYNTGDTAGTYVMEVTFNENQDEHKPDADWVEFSPKNFVLGPGESQVVTITLRLPSGLRSGDYYAYLEAQSKQESSDGGATISTAAAAKFCFTAASPPQDEIAQEQIIPVPAPSGEIVPTRPKVDFSLDVVTDTNELASFGINRLVQDQIWKQKIL